MISLAAPSPVRLQTTRELNRTTCPDEFPNFLFGEMQVCIAATLTDIINGGRALDFALKTDSLEKCMHVGTRVIDFSGEVAGPSSAAGYCP